MRTRLVWRTADIKRTFAALAALAIIGIVGAAMCWAGIWSLVILAHAVAGG